MRFVLIPFAICLLLYIRQENQYRFRAATALKILLTMTLTVCLTVALVRNFSPVLLLAAVGMLLCAGGDFFLQYIRLDAAKFTKGILLFGLGQMCNITALSLLAPFHWCAAALLAALLALAVVLKTAGRWDTSVNDPWLTIYTVLVAATAAKSLSVAITCAGLSGGVLLGLGGALFFLLAMRSESGRMGTWSLAAAAVGFCMYMHTLSAVLLPVFAAVDAAAVRAAQGCKKVIKKFCKYAKSIFQKSRECFIIKHKQKVD